MLTFIVVNTVELNKIPNHVIHNSEKPLISMNLFDGAIDSSSKLLI